MTKKIILDHLDNVVIIIILAGYTYFGWGHVINVQENSASVLLPGTLKAGPILL